LLSLVEELVQVLAVLVVVAVLVVLGQILLFLFS
jgi:hypothetical protein